MIEYEDPRQVWPLKDPEAFQSKEGICYIPEACDAGYTYQDFVDIAHGNTAVARLLFWECEWQHPTTLFEEGIMYGEWDEEGNLLDHDKEEEEL